MDTFGRTFHEIFKTIYQLSETTCSYGIVGNDIVSDGSRFRIFPDAYTISTEKYGFGSIVNNVVAGAKRINVRFGKSERNLGKQGPNRIMVLIYTF